MHLSRLPLSQALDLVLVSPLLLPVFGLLAFTGQGGAVKAAVDKAAAERSAESARSAQKAAQDKVASLQKQLSDERAAAAKKLEEQKSATVKRMTEGKASLRRDYDKERRRASELEATIRKCVRMRAPRALAGCAAISALPLRASTVD